MIVPNLFHMVIAIKPEKIIDFDKLKQGLSQYRKSELYKTQNRLSVLQFHYNGTRIALQPQ